MRLLFLSLLVLLVACSAAPSGGDASLDSGGTTDGGASGDGSSGDAAATDAGTHVDGSMDAGASADGGCAPLPIHCLPACDGVEPPAMCIAGTLTCPPPPVCDGGAAVDAGDTFVCSGSVTCSRHNQYCDLSDVAECLPIPTSCPTPATCACLAGMGHTSCVDDGAGGITTHSPGG